MSKNVIGARMIHLFTSSTNTGITATVPSPDTNDHTMGWGATDIYKGEIFMHMVSNRAWTRMNTGITEFMMADTTTGKMPNRFMPNLVDGNFLVTENLTIGGLSLPTPSSDLRAVFADSNGMLTISSIIPGQGTVRKVMATYGLVSDPSTGITDMGTIQMGLPHSIHSGSTNDFINNTGHTHQFIPAGNTNEIQINSGGTLSSSSNFKYDGYDLYVSNMTPSGTSYAVYYDPLNGKITYNLLTGGGTVTSISVGYGLSGSTPITSTGTISLGTPFPITEFSNGDIFSNGHDHKFSAAVGVVGSIQHMTSTSGITGDSNFKYVSNSLYLLGMTSSGTSNVVCYNTSSGRLTYTPMNNGTVTSISEGSGMSFTTINNSGVIGMGLPSNITSLSINQAIGNTHTHAFSPNGGDTEIQINSGGTLGSSSNFTYNGIDLYISGMTNSGTSYCVYYDDTTGQLTYDVKPTGGGTPGGIDTSIQFNSGSTFTGNNDFTYNGIDLYISGMTNNITNDVIYYDSNTGQLTYGIKPTGGGTSLPTGTTSFDTVTDWVVDSYSTTSYKFMIYHYCVYSGETNSRAGTITIVNTSVVTRITESSTSDIGSTNGVTFSSAMNGSNVELRVDSLTNGWICDWIKITK